MSIKDPEVLHTEPRFELLLVMEHDNLFPAIRGQLFRKSRVMCIFWVFHALVLLAMVVVALSDTQNGWISWAGILQRTAIGLLLVFTVVIAAHEGIHALAYRMVGARRISFGVNWRWFYFYAVADRFVVGRGPFRFVALAPFVVVSAFCMVGMFFCDVGTKWILWGVLLFHTHACIGDFAILSFYEPYGKYPDVLTYDDVKAGRSYFFLQRES